MERSLLQSLSRFHRDEDKFTIGHPIPSAWLMANVIEMEPVCPQVITFLSQDSDYLMVVFLSGRKFTLLQEGICLRNYEDLVKKAN